MMTRHLWAPMVPFCPTKILLCSGNPLNLRWFCVLFVEWPFENIVCLILFWFVFYSQCFLSSVLIYDCSLWIFVVNFLFGEGEGDGVWSVCCSLFMEKLKYWLLFILFKWYLKFVQVWIFHKSPLCLLDLVNPLVTASRQTDWKTDRPDRQKKKERNRHIHTNMHMSVLAQALRVLIACGYLHEWMVETVWQSIMLYLFCPQYLKNILYEYMMGRETKVQ